jgi:hypothetical protein
MSILEMRRLSPELFYTRIGSWYETEKFATEDKTGHQWLAVKKKPARNSLARTWCEQNAILSPGEYVPNIAAVVWTILVFHLTRNVRLFPNIVVRTASRTGRGHHVDVGGFQREGMLINAYGDARINSIVGLSIARKTDAVFHSRVCSD